MTERNTAKETPATTQATRRRASIDAVCVDGAASCVVRYSVAEKSPTTTHHPASSVDNDARKSRFKCGYVDEGGGDGGLGVVVVVVTTTRGEDAAEEADEADEAEKAGEAEEAEKAAVVRRNARCLDARVALWVMC